MIWALAGCAALDGTPPELALVGPDGPTREVRIAVTAADDAPGLGAVRWSVDGGPWTDWESAPIVLDDLPDGVHTVRVTATDRSWRANTTEASWTGTVDRTPPALTLDDASRVAAQGRTWAVWVDAAELLVDPEVRWGERRWPMYPVGGRWRALVGVPIRAEPGPTPVTISASDAVGNRAEREETLTIAETAFEVGGSIRLTKAQTEARKDEPAKAAMRAERDAAYAHPEPAQRWSGPFRLPVAGRRTSPFGKYRRYSDGARSHHTGLDLAARRGTPVSAAADGVVLVAGWQVLFGNVVIVHHGQGVSTSYNHLDAVEVAVGDEVVAGQVVGRLGSTGQSTGPHLHWGLVVGGEAVDPDEWLRTGFEPPDPG